MKHKNMLWAVILCQMGFLTILLVPVQGSEGEVAPLAHSQHPFSGVTIRVSNDPNGTAGYGTSQRASISTDGRYVAFESWAHNLVAGDTNNDSDIFVHDLLMEQTTRVSVASDGTPGNTDSHGSAITSDGRYVAFYSYSSNLVTGDTNNRTDIFVHDRKTGQTQRMSVASNGAQGNGNSSDPSISDDGRYIAFWSTATNLVTDDTNARADIFVHDGQTGQTQRVSVSSDGIQGNQTSGTYGLAISADGRYVAFYSEASNLVSGDTNHAGDIFVHDRQTGQTSRVSVAWNGAQSNGISDDPSISANGRYIAFDSNSDNLVPGDTNIFTDVFVYDRQMEQIQRVSVSSNGTQGNGFSSDPFISANGRYVTFVSGASLVSGDTNEEYDVFTHDRQTGETHIVSLATDGTQGNGWCSDPSISGDGNLVAFGSFATTLVSPDNNGVQDIFVHCSDGNCTSALYRIYLPILVR